MFRVIRVERRKRGMRARTVDPAMFYGRVSAYRVTAMRKLSLTLLYPPGRLRPR